MNTLTRWEPFKELEDLQNRLSNLFGRRTCSPHGESGGITLAEWAPLVDITEDDKEWVVKADLPEVKKEDVKVTVENGVLTITGERKFEKEEKDKKYHRIERSYGNFLRSFTLPDAADELEGPEFKDGVLKVRLPKSEKAKPNKSPSAENGADQSGWGFARRNCPQRWRRRRREEAIRRKP